MAIGKPLLVQERKGVAKPVLSPQTQQLSTNVAAQKMEMADYNIGMNNAMASQQVTGELVSMVNAGINAKVYAEQTKQQYNRLNLMEDWNKTDNNFKQLFAKAITPEEQQVVLDDYSESMELRTANYRKGGGTGLPTGDSIQSQRDLSSLRNRSNNLYSKFATTMNTNINTRTNSMLDLRMAKALQDGKMNKNADPVSIMNTVKESLAQKVAIGGITQDRAMFNLEVATNKFIVDRGSLYAKDLAREQVKNGTPPSSPDEVRKRLNEVMGFKLNDSQVKILDEVTTDTYYKELSIANTQNDAEENRAWQLEKDKYIEFKTSVIKDISDGLLTGTSEETIIKQAEVYDAAHPGRGILNEIQKLVSSHKNGAPTKRYVDYWTTGAGGEVLRKIADDPDSNKQDGYYDLSRFHEVLDEQAIISGHEGMNLNTNLGILNWYKTKNTEIAKNLVGQTEGIVKGLVTKWYNDDTSFLYDAAKKNPKIGAKFLAAMQGDSLNYKALAESDPDLGVAYHEILEWANLQQTNKSGVFTDENMDKASNVRYAQFSEALKSKARAAFIKAFNLSQTKLQEEQKDTALDLAAKTREEQAQKYHQEYLERKKQGLYRPRKVPKMDDISPTVSFLDSLVPEVGFSLEAFKQSAFDSVATGFVTSMANKKLRKTIEKDIGRPLTPSELAGGNVAINKMAEKYIESSKEGTISKTIGQLVSDVWHTTVPFTSDVPQTTMEEYHSLVEDFTNESQRRMELGIKSYQPIEPTPDVKKVPTPTTEPRPVPEIGETISSIISSVGSALSPTEATAGDTPLESTARYFDAENQPTDVIPQEVWNRLPKHSLSAGDTLSDLANQYNISVEELQRLNPQTVGRETALQIGEQIALPSMQQPQQKVEDMDFGEKSTVPGLDKEYLRQTESKESFPEAEEAVSLEQYESFLKTREATRTEAVADVGSGVDPDGAGYGHILNKKEKEWWESAPIKQREAQADKWFKEDVEKARSAAQKQMKPLEDRADSDTLESTLTSINFQLGTEWRTKFPKAWKGIAAGQNKGTTPMFKDKTGWDQAIYHLMHANEKSKKPSKWLVQTPTRVMDAVLAIHAISGAGNKEDIIAHIDNILEGLK